MSAIPPILRHTAARMGLDEVHAVPPPPDVDLTVIFRSRDGIAEVTIQQCIDEVDDRGWFESAPEVPGQGAMAYLHHAEGGQVVDVCVRMAGWGGEMALDAARSLCAASYK